MVIRKISIGSDYKSSAMHYIVSQEILGGTHQIYLIRYDEKSNTYKVWIQKNNEVFLWKEFNSSIPVTLEYNINIE